ncbi:MAG: dehydrogenase, partial [Planctomycetota bacterium]
MKQILNHLRTGQIEIADVPCPVVRPNHLLIQSTRSLISAGTERMLVEFAQAGLIAKARSQPDKVRQVLDKIKTDGLLPTLETVFSRLDEPLPLGYCNVGRVVEVGAGVRGFQVGDRVASSGSHAEMVCVPATLAAKVPDDVDDDSASFTVLGSIALNGVRLLQPTFGEQFVVYGLGLLGILSVQLLRAHGCQVLGVDLNRQRCELAERFGAQSVCIRDGGDPLRAADVFAGGRGVDGVLITASAKGDSIVSESARMCRKRGRIVLVGVVNLSLNRAEFYERELSFQVACSYGPGRYDPVYESGHDYPLPYVRWTVARNFDALLGAMASRQLDVAPLVSRSVPLADAAQAYDAVVKDGSVLGVVIEYPQQPAPTQRVVSIAEPVAARPSEPTRPVIGVIGAGNFTKLVLLPAIRAAGAPIRTIASAGGVTALHAARKFGAQHAVSDYRAILDDPQINTVFITTRHNSHAKMVVEALQAGKHVFVEKPIAIDEDGLQSVRDAHAAHPDRLIMCGFNRRFAPHAARAHELLAGRSEPLAINITINAGEMPADVWHHDPQIGGG